MDPWAFMAGLLLTCSQGKIYGLFSQTRETFLGESEIGFVMNITWILDHHSLLRRGLLQYSRALTARLGKNVRRLGRGEIKARGGGGSFPALPFSLSSAPVPVFFFHWCLLTGASAEERVTSNKTGSFPIGQHRMRTHRIDTGTEHKM